MWRVYFVSFLNVFMCGVTLGVIAEEPGVATAVVLGPLGPLSQGRALQAATFVDGEHPDQPALYALLADVAAWPADAEAGAALVDWRSVLAEPAAWRGRAVVVEGRDAGRRRRIDLVRPQLPWGEAVTEWGVVVDVADDAGGVRGLPVVVWFVDPADAIPASDEGRAVRVVGRFLGLWRDTDAGGQARDYPVVVAASVAVLPGSGAAGELPVAYGLLGAVAGLGLVWWWGRRFLRRDVVAARRAGRRGAGGRLVELDEPSESEALPGEPEAALAVLRERAERS